MTTLTHDAQEALDRYLRQVAAALRGHPSVDATEVARDVRGHIDAELAGQPTPITAHELQRVLNSLGPPSTWVPQDDLSAWRRVLTRLQVGPEDWRLAYLALGFFVAGATLFLGGNFLWPLAPVLTLMSVLFARACLTLLAERDEPVGARRWFIYPPLVALYAPVAVGLFVLPLPLFGQAVMENPIMRDKLSQLVRQPSSVTIAASGILTLGIWWALLGSALRGFPGTLRTVFWPFAEWFERRHATRLALAGFVLVLSSLIVLFAGGRLSAAAGAPP